MAPPCWPRAAPTCGRAESERGTLWLAAPSLGHLEVVSEDPLRVRASFAVGTGAATLFVLDARGEVLATLDEPAAALMPSEASND